MADDETAPEIKGTKTHPYIAEIVIDPVQWCRLEANFEDRPEVKIRKVDDQTPDTWKVYVACASVAVKDLLEES